MEQTEEQRERLSSDPPETVDPETERKAAALREELRKAEAEVRRQLAAEEQTRQEQPPAPPKLAQVQIATAATGWPATVVVDGVDMSRHVDRVVLDAQPMQIPRVTLRAVGDFSFDGAAVVEVHDQAPVDPMAWARDAEVWLSGLNMQSMLQAITVSGSMSQPLGEAFREALLADLRRYGA